MEKKTFEISEIKSEEDLNALTIALNEKEQVSHIKVEKNHISFNCIDIDALLSVIQSIDNQLVVNEVIDGKKREYDFAQRKEMKHYFMFRNMLSEDDIFVLVDKIKDDNRFRNVEYDQSNKLLILDSSQKDVLSILRKELFKINPSMEIIEHRKPIRSQDVFDQRFLRTYAKVAVGLVAFALALITSKDDTWITMACWYITVIMLAEKTVKGAWEHLKQFKFFHTDIVMILAFILGVASGSYIETCIAVIVYYLTVPITNRFLEYALNKIDETVQMPEKGIRLVNGEEETISLYEFEKGDTLVVYPNETIHIPGVVTKGPSQINTYSNTSQFELKRARIGTEVHSGDINVGDKPLHIKISSVYESSNYIELMNIASNAPSYESKIEKMVKKLSVFYTPLMVLLAIAIGIVLPILDYRTYASYIHTGAILMIISGALFNDQSTSLAMLAGFAKAFQSGIVIESSIGLDSINATQTIVYDRFDGVEVTEEELDLFKKLSHMGRTLVIFNDGPVALENDQYTIYNDLTLEEKLEKMDSLIGPIVYIGDSFKDIALLQKSYVGISRGGLADLKVVENSDIVLIDSDLNKVFETFVIARKMRTNAVVNNIITVLVKLIMLISLVSFAGIPMWLAILINIVVGSLVLFHSTAVLE